MFREDSKELTVEIAGVERTDVHIHQIQSGCCGHPDTATFEILQRGRDQTNLQEFALQIENSIVKISGDSTLHYGRAVRIGIKQTQQGQFHQFTSRMDDHLFGNPHTSTTTLISDFLTNETIEVVGMPMVFNPMFEGVLRGNRHTIDGTNVIVAIEQLFINPIFEMWNLSQLVFHVCQKLNPDEQHVKNPTLAECEAVFVDEPVQNIEIKLGAYLPDVLSSVVVPLGYGWHVEHGEDDRKIAFYKPISPELFSVATEDKVEFDISSDNSSNNVTAIQIIGGNQQIESTFELTPDWNREGEGRPITDYRINGPEWENNPGLANVYRLWSVSTIHAQPDSEGTLILPEAGLNHSRGNITPESLQILTGEQEPFFFRRQFKPCISQRIDGRPYGRFDGCFIEYAIVEGENELEWIPIDGGESGMELKNGRSIEVVDDALSVYFNGQLPPPAQQVYGTDNFRLRITATIETIGRKTVVEQTSNSLLSDDKPLVVDMPTAFPFRRVQDSVLSNRADASQTSATDSENAMRLFAGNLLFRQSSPQSEGYMVFPGILSEWRGRIGKAIQKIDRPPLPGLSFSNGQNFPIVDQVSFDIQAQTTRIEFRDPYAK